MCAFPQPYEDFGLSTQECESGHKLQRASWGVPHFSPRPAPSGGGRQAGKLLSWIASSKPNYNTFQTHFPRRAF
jgi:hypothetical protein